MKLLPVAIGYCALAAGACSTDAGSSSTSSDGGELGGAGAAVVGNGGAGGGSTGTGGEPVGGAGESGGSGAAGTTAAGGSGGMNGTGGSGGGAVMPNAGKQCSAVAAADHEQYHLPAPMNLPMGVISQTDWAAIPASGGWYGAQIMDACRMHPDGFVTWHGKAAVRVEVDPKDDPLVLGANSERAEMLTLQTSGGAQILDGASSGVQFYATSYYFPSTWGGTQLPWSAYPNMDCASGNQEQCNSWSFVLQFHGDTIAWGGLIAAQTSVAGPQHYDLTLGGKHFPFPNGGPIALGKWTDFVLELDWATGAVNAWRRDEGQSAFTAATGGTVTIPAEKMYLKQGLYRGANVNGRVDVFWIGPTAQGTTFAAVEQAVFGTSNGP